MNIAKHIWLITNAASGSNDESGLALIEQTCRKAGLIVARRTTFPGDPLPTPEVLDAHNTALLAIFAGDGTVNAALQAVAGWKGQVMILPGGTMNLLFHRLFGEMAMEEVIARVAAGEVQARRPGIVTCPQGQAFAEVMAGPGTSWSAVREAIREGSIMALAAEATTALAETIGGNMLACSDPPIGRAEGYPLLTITVSADALKLTAYFAETAGEVLDQAAAMAARDFRKGPHEVIGHGDQFTLSVPAGGRFGVLLDGELEFADRPARFSLARCKVDLLATRPDG